MDSFRNTILNALLCGTITREVANAILEAQRNCPNVEYSDTAEGFHEMRRIMYLIKCGRKIEAIKAFRSTFKVGLRGAKDAVEAMIEEIPRLPGY